MELPPIDRDSALELKIVNHKGVKSISPFAYKGGIIKSSGVVQGCVFKGVDQNYDWSNFRDWLISGSIPSLNSTKKTKDIIISKLLANKLHLDIDSSILMYFMQDPPRIRKFRICGIYESGFSDFDNKFIYGDIKHIQKLNAWKNNEIAGYEVVLNNFDDMEKVSSWIYDEVDYNLKALNINQRYPFIMDWLGLLDTNVYFILGLMIMISGIGMIATLLILILEKTKFIGSMMAMGATNKSIRKIFIYHSLHLSFRGLLMGNTIGIGIAIIQYYLKVIPLDASTYYMDAVPINLNPIYIISLNIGIIAIIALMMLWPSRIISKITPVKALRHE